jgi:DNA-binding NarL/FixJ family response regulator
MPELPSPGPEGADDRITVVLVDDHRMFADSMARLLSAEPDLDVVATVASAEEALRAVARHRPRVVLLDHQLPGRSGVEVARDIKATTPDVMVVMITGSTEDRVLLGAIDAGCSGFLTKDHAADEVAEAVRAAAAGDVLIPPALLARLLPQLNRAHRGLGWDLSPREIEVLGLLATGAANKAIATQLHLSVNTIRNHVQQILTKLGVHSKLEAVATAVREGIISYPE